MDYIYAGPTSGKTTAQKMLQEKGFNVFDTDELMDDLIDDLMEEELIPDDKPWRSDDPEVREVYNDAFNQRIGGWLKDNTYDYVFTNKWDYLRDNNIKPVVAAFRSNPELIHNISASRGDSDPIPVEIAKMWFKQEVIQRMKQAMPNLVDLGKDEYLMDLILPVLGGEVHA